MRVSDPTKYRAVIPLVAVVLLCLTLLIQKIWASRIYQAQSLLALLHKSSHPGKAQAPLIILYRQDSTKRTMFKSPKDFVIVHRDGSAQPDYIYPWNGRLAACITKSIIYSLGYLRHPRVKNALVSYAVGHSRFERNAWYKDPVYGYKDMNQVVSDFITYVSANFFLICIDSTINNPDCLGATANREWNGRFSARDYCISLNAAVRERPPSPRPYCLIKAEKIIESWRYGCSSDESSTLSRPQRLR